MSTSGSIPVSELREQLAAVIDDLPTHGKAIQLTRHGQPVAVLMGFEAFEALLDDLDDADDHDASSVISHGVARRAATRRTAGTAR